MALDDVPREWLVAVAALAVIVVVWTLLRRLAQRMRMRRRFARGAEGEREALAMLEAEGFTLEGAQVTGTYVLHVDEAPVAIRVFADSVVRRGPARYVAEVKTGRLAPRVETAATRRQLLEYEHAFGVDGVLLVDADARTVRRVVFSRPLSARRAWWPFAVAALAVIVVVLLR